MGRFVRRIPNWPIDRLEASPLSREVFGEPGHSEEDEALLEDIKIRGLEQPLDVLPNGTVIGGHRRLWAAKELGMDEVPVAVREELKDDEEAIAAFVLRDNLMNRNLRPSQIAKSYLKAKEIPVEKGGLGGRHGGDQEARGKNLPLASQGRAIDLFGKVVGLSGETLRKLVRLFSEEGVKPDILERLDAGELSISKAYAQAFPAPKKPPRKSRWKVLSEQCEVPIAIIEGGVSDLDGLLKDELSDHGREVVEDIINRLHVVIKELRKHQDQLVPRKKAAEVPQEGEE